MADRSEKDRWPTPGAAPTPGELVDRLTQALGSAGGAPDPQDVLEGLTEVLEHGTSAYRAAERPIDVLDHLMASLGDEERSLLMAYEERLNESAERWAIDRFRVGYALGAALGFPPS